MADDGAPDRPLRVALSIGGCVTGNFLLRAGSAAATSTIALSLAHMDRNGVPVPATMVGLLSVTFYLTELVTAPVFGALSDRFGGRYFMWLGGLFGALAVLLLPAAPTIPLFLLARVAEGLSSASSIPAVLGYLAVQTSGSSALRGRVMATFEIATVLGFAAGFATGGFLWDGLHLNAFYVISGIYALAIAAFVAVRTPRITAHRHRHANPFSALPLLRNAAIIGFIPAWLSVNAILGNWFTHLGFQLAREANTTQLLVGGFSGTRVGLVSGGIALVFVLGTAAWSLAFGRIKTRTIMAIALQAIAWCAILLYLLNHTPPQAVARIWVFSAGIAVSLLVVSGFTPAALAHLAELSESIPGHRGAMMGLYSVLLSVGQLLGGWIGGYFAQAWAVDGLILLTVALGLAANASILLLARAGTLKAPAERSRDPVAL